MGSREARMSENQPAASIGCAGPPSQALLVGVRQFNEGEYFACHETLEALWLAEGGPIRRFYQGILQVGVGLYHLQRGNERGALALLGRGRELLRPFAPVCQGLEVAALVQGAERVLQTLQSLGMERTLGLGRECFPRIRLVAQHVGTRPLGEASG